MLEYFRLKEVNEKDLENYSPRKVLIIKSCRIEQFFNSVNYFRNIFKDSLLSLLIHSNNNDVIEVYKNDFEMILFPEGRFFKVSSDVAGILRYLKNADFDLVVINSNNSAFAGYEDVVDFVFSFLKSGKVVAMLPSGEVFVVKREVVGLFYNAARYLKYLFFKLMLMMKS